MSTRKATIGILVTLATLWAGTTLAEAAPGAEGVSVGKALRTLWGKGITVHTVTGRIHRGTLALHDHKSLTLRLGRKKAITLQLTSIAKIETTFTTYVFRVARQSSRGHWKPAKVPTEEPTGDTKGNSGGAALIGLGVAAMAAGVLGVVFGTLGARAAKKEAASDGRELCTMSFWSDSSDDDCKPRTLRNLYPGAGYTTLAVLGALGAVAGLALTAHGAILSRKYARALEKYRPQVNIDPVNKRYSVSMSLSF